MFNLVYTTMIIRTAYGSCILHQTVGVGFFCLAFKQSCSMYTFSVILIIVGRDR